ncbi:peptide-methionine (R)-S-oxide reductase [Aestuariibius insulae]|uniref:peptide-methionine (R)-S-oxide reductase n=1 Tax=Aestuariibius insulae TaxID=2058287 RepID=UPI00345E379A
MTSAPLDRRTFLGTAALGSAAIAAGSSARADLADRLDAYQFEVNRPEGEWREMLSNLEFNVLREGGTEPARSHPYWEASEPGVYSCKACDLPLYDSEWKVILPMGWVFFYHSRPTAILTDIDRSGPMTGGTGPAIEAACRRCGSHHGHIVGINNEVIHCINGAGLTFTPSAT